MGKSGVGMRVEQGRVVQNFDSLMASGSRPVSRQSPLHDETYSDSLLMISDAMVDDCQSLA